MSAPEPLTIRLKAEDNVVTCREELPAGTSLGDENLSTGAVIPAGHKIATQAIAKSEPVRKYDQIIGFATEDIAVGDHVHVHNVEVRDFERDYKFGADVRNVEMVPEPERATFQGIVREDGRVATRNYVGILTSVNCSASVARMIADRFRGDALAEFENVDGVVPLTHDYGCGGCAGIGLNYIQRTIAGHAKHPNFAASLLVGLGCEANQIGAMMEAEQLNPSETLHAFTIQDTGGSEKTIEHGVGLVREMLQDANRVSRQTVSASELILGLECGGSDAYSGISANPALGAAADLLVQNGGTACLAETPEIYGAEHLLTRRAINREVGEKLIAHIKWWEEYTAAMGAEMNNNPSPGNKAGGLTTILEKSLGAAAKGGTTNLMDVYQYAEQITEKGFVFMNTPGYDPASITGMVAGGANVVCFTTGRGSVYGGKPVPSLKLATNSVMYNRMSGDMDVNCGAIVDGDASVEEVGREIFDTILATASGEASCSEALGMGDDEFVPWTVGAIL